MDDDVGAVDERVDGRAVQHVALAVLGLAEPVGGRVERPARHPDDPLDVPLRSSARMNGLPISPVGPVTATVRPMALLQASSYPSSPGSSTRAVSPLSDDLRLDRQDLAAARRTPSSSSALAKLPQLLEVLDRREDEQDLAGARARRARRAA